MIRPAICAIALAAGLAACGGDARAPALPPRVAEPPEAPRPTRPKLPEYALADLDARPAGTALALDQVSFGVVLDGERAVIRDGAVSVIPGATGPSTRVEAIPSSLGGGFLFHDGKAIYRAPSFDGPLQPLIALGGVSRISFGPKAALIRGTTGDRWMMALPAGALTEVTPTGLVDVAMLPDGRVAAITEGGGALVSADGGATFRDVTGRLGDAPSRVFTTGPLAHRGSVRGPVPAPAAASASPAIASELWIVTSAGLAFQVDPTGALSEFSQAPTTPRPQLRARDPRWRPDEPPLRRAIRAGARITDEIAIVATDGDIVRVDLRTGAIVGVVAGRLPPDLPCEALRVEGDVLAVCARAGKPSIVVSQLDKDARIERTFPTDGVFYGSPDGALAFAGPCGAAKPSAGDAAERAPGPGHVVCVRAASGEWHEVRRDLLGETQNDPSLPSFGAPLPNTASVRWIPRPDGTAASIAVGWRVLTLDVLTSKRYSIHLPDLPKPVADALLRAVRPGVFGAIPGGHLVDRQWSVTEGGGLRGWAENGQSIEITPDDRSARWGAEPPASPPADSQASVKSAKEEPRAGVSLSSFTFDKVSPAGAFAFGATREGRVWQSTDFGANWAEVAAPPIAKASTRVDLRSCSPIGCDLGAWLRFGWEPTAPVAVTPASPPAQAPLPERAPLPLLTCVASGETRRASVPPSGFSPDDLGLGAARIPVAQDEGVVQRQVLTRGLTHPIHGSSGEDEAPRAVLHGFALDLNFEDAPSIHRMRVPGTNATLQTYRRDLAFLEPFDPTGAVRRSGIPLSAVLSTARAASIEFAEVFGSGGFPDVSEMVPVAPLDPAGAGDLLFTLSTDSSEILGIARGGKAPKVKVAWAHPRRGVIVSAAAAGPDDVVVLAVGDGGEDRIFKMGATSVTDLHQIPAPPTVNDYPANPDAVLIGPGGAVGVLRTPSGTSPPTAQDPALLFLMTGPPIALAPWSTLTLAEDPACRADTGGFRGIVQTTQPWMRVRVGGASPEPAGAMYARVRWSKARVCLEAIELRSSPQPGLGDTGESWLVARFAGAPLAGIVGVALGGEIRQPLSCALGPR